MKKMTKIISFLLTFALIFAVSAPSFAWQSDEDAGAPLDGKITIESYGANSATHSETQRSMAGRTFAAYRILSGESNGAENPEDVKIVYSVPTDMEEFYQQYNWPAYPAGIRSHSVFGREISSIDEVASMPSVFVQDNKISDIDIMRAIAELDSQIEYVGPVDSENNNIMPMDAIGGSTGDALRDEVLKKLNDYPNDSAELEHFSDAVLEYIIQYKKFDANSGNSIYMKQVTGGEGATSIELTGLPYGYYVVAELNADGTHQHITTTLLTNVYNSAGVQLYTKDVEPTVEKYIDDSNIEGTENNLLNPGKKGNTAKVGDTVEYRIIANLPDVEGFDREGDNVYKFIIEDTLGPGLTFNIDDPDLLGNNSQIKLTLFKDNSQAGESITPLSTAIESAKIESATEGGTKLTLNFKSSWIYDNGIKEGSTAETKIPYIVIQYSAEVNSGAVVGEGGNENSVVVEYNDVYDQNAQHTNTSTVKTYMVSIDLKKADLSSKDGAVQYLDGAIFTLRKGTDTSAEYASAVTGDLITAWSKSNGDAHKFEVKDGNLTISGLEAGTYYLKEEQAPAGYKAIDEEIEFTVSANGTSETELGNVNIEISSAQYLAATNSSGDVNASLTVFDEPGGGLLPGTGGIGRVIIYTLGSILVIGAVVLLILKKRSAKNNA